MPNHLQNETSPYLLQHKDNPVHWYPWCEEAFEAAVSLNRPIFLSIGYSTCYWCHMMEKDSFEQNDVASVLNDYFIAIKVDREERPDVDQLYMDVVTGLTDHGGWPMSVFMTPDKKPFWGGTFVKREQFIALMKRLHEVWTNEPQKIKESAESIIAALRAGNVKKNSTPENYQYKDAWKRGCEALVRNFDHEFGGFGPAPKFPPAQQIRSLLSFPKAPETFHLAALTTLENMGKRALFDHIEGGFHRYATDAAWEIPHFEKMLYDNALLIPAYVKGYQTSGYVPFLSLAENTANYLTNRMMTQDGLFKSAEDAGDAGKEGEFYIWSPQEIESLPNDLKEQFKKDFFFSAEGNFEGNLTLVGHSLQVMTSPELTPLRTHLRQLRDKRTRPLCDSKIITSWNGLCLTAFSVLSRVTHSSAHYETAKKVATQILSKSASGLPRLLSDSTRITYATLEDYAFTIEGLIEIYQTDSNEEWLLAARKLQQEQDSNLWSEERGLYRSSAATDLIAERFEIVDGAMPSPNSISLENTKFLSKAFEDHTLFEKSNRINTELSFVAHQYPSAMSRYFVAMHRYTNEIVITAPLTADEHQQAQMHIGECALFYKSHTGVSLLPAIASKANGLFFYCTDGSCQRPETTFSKLLKLHS